MAKQNNAECAICGKLYSVCRTCTEVKSFMPWRTVVDNIQHYMIYTAIHGYTVSKDKTKAKTELEKCDLSDYKDFNPEIVNIINEIIKDDKPKITKSKKTYGKSSLSNDKDNIDKESRIIKNDKE